MYCAYYMFMCCIVWNVGIEAISLRLDYIATKMKQNGDFYIHRNN